MTSIAVGDGYEIDGVDWEITEIEQPYDEAGNMLEPVVHFAEIYPRNEEKATRTIPMFTFTRAVELAEKRQSAE